MTDPLPPHQKQALADKLLESLTATLPMATPREVYGRVGLPGKATAVIGMRRAGKTTFSTSCAGSA